jgi:hypothetical protein
MDFKKAFTIDVLDDEDTIELSMWSRNETKVEKSLVNGHCKTALSLKSINPTRSGPSVFNIDLTFNLASSNLDGETSEASMLLEISRANKIDLPACLISSFSSPKLGRNEQSTTQNKAKQNKTEDQIILFFEYPKNTIL